jgi:hypothetical protein
VTIDKQQPAQLDSPPADDSRPDRAEPSWGRVLLTTVQLWAARRARPQRLFLVAVALAVVAAVALTVPLFTGSSAARTASSSAGPSAITRRAAYSASSPPLTAAQSAAAAWIVGQVDSSATVGCDSALCAALQARGVPAGRLVPLGPTMAGAMSADVIEVPRSADRGLVSRYAPGLIASFGAGAGAIDIRAVARGGAAAYETALRADSAARRSAGAQLLGNPRLRFGAADAVRLRTGEVDSRLLATLAALSSQLTLRVTAFSDSAPGAPALYREVTVVSGRAKNGGASLAGALALVNAQVNPYLPAHAAIVERAAGGQAWLVIQFASPSPLGLLTTVLTADTEGN